MAEQCAKCSSAAARVEIGGRSYCGSCGVPAAPNIAVHARTMSDLGARTKHPVSSRPAAALHNRTGMAKGGVVDLRTSTLNKSQISPVRKSINPLQAKVGTKPELEAKVSNAKRISRHEKISRFQTNEKTAETVNAVKSVTNLPKVAEHVTNQRFPAHAETHHRALTRLAPSRPGQSGRNASKTESFYRYASIGTAVLIMAGYVWLQNFPKLELHSASGKAGFSLTLPSYLPSSYSLSGPVEAVRGSAIISFKSPSSKSPLKITQQATSWDSSSLRDNVVAIKSNDFTSVQGQGLTIYLWGNNQAAWVNHGIWYGIEGAGQLSREQIVKIAYSL